MVFEAAFAEVLAERTVYRHNDQAALLREAWKKEGQDKANARYPDDSSHPEYLT